MGLQIRVRHALGDQLMDLPDATAQSPVVVGRGASCAVQLPSASVAGKHCALFRHEGRWIVQDVRGSGGTFVNGKQVPKAASLKIGDVITIGTEPDAPTIEVDPAAAAEGRTGRAGQSAATSTGDTTAAQSDPDAEAAAPQRPLYPTAIPAPVYTAPTIPTGGYPAPGHPAAGIQATGYPAAGYPAAGYPAPAAAPGYPPQPAWGAAPTEADELAALQAAAVAPVGYSRPRKARRGNGVAITITIVIALGILGVTVWFVMNQHPRVTYVNVIKGDPNKTAAVTPATPATQPTTAPTRRPKVDPLANADDDSNPIDKGAVVPTVRSAKYGPEIASLAPPTPADIKSVPDDKSGLTSKADKKPKSGGDSMQGSMDKPPAAKATATADAMPAPVKPAATAPAKPAFPAGSWEEIVSLSQSPSDAAMAVFKFDDYKRLNAGKHDSEIDTFTEQKLDRIWWERIDQLFKKRDKLATDMEAIQKKIWDQNNPDEKKKEIAEKTKMDKEKKVASDMLRNAMGYASDQPPDLTSDAKLAALATKRDGPKYTFWKKTTLKSILDNHGKLPWEGE